MSAFDPNSENAVLSQILANLKSLTADVGQMKTELFRRVTDIEIEQATNRGKVIGFTAVASILSGVIAWLGTLWATHK